MALIRVKIRYLGVLAEYTGKLEEEVSISNEVTIKQLLLMIFKEYPQISTVIQDVLSWDLSRGSSIMVIVNGRIVTSNQELDYVLRDGDVVIVTPFLAGGA